MKSCFVIMPFRPELVFLFRELKHHLESVFPEMRVHRGDDEALTVTLLEKIRGYINNADVIIADCSGRNPNVFYELGMAHAFGKPVVLLTGDPIEDRPTDIQAHEFISYAKSKPEEFLERLERTVSSVVGNPYTAYYPEALVLYDEFRQATPQLALDPPVTEAEFTKRAMVMRSSGNRMPTVSGTARHEALIRRMLGIEPKLEVMTALKKWLEARDAK